MSYLKNFTASCSIAAMVFLFLPVVLCAQGTSTIQGHISDPTGAAVPGATVTAANENTGVSRTTVSADDGYYRIADLLPGSYQLKVELPGFKTAIKSGIQVAAQAIVGHNFSLQIGEVSELVTVTGEEPLVETQLARISEVIGERDIRSLPAQGRGVLNLTMMSPGIQGKAESVGGFCCDVFSNFAAPIISSGGREVKANFSLDGLNLRYTEGSSWGAFFSPSPDAVAEVRVSTNAHSAEFGTMSGPQVQIVTKGGTNTWHGTAHFTDQEDNFNARPSFFGEPEVPNSYTRLYGATAGGPILKDRLFVFGAFEGLRELEAASSIVLAETQQFADFLSRTRPNTIASALLKAFPPFRYPTSRLVDLGSPSKGVNQWSEVPDGVPDLGEVTLDQPNWRRGKQFNGRVDYHFPNGKDRVFGTYWFTRPEWQNPALRKAFQGTLYSRINTGSAVYTRTFSASTLNETRFSYTDFLYENKHSGAYHIPGVATDDGISLGNFGWSKEYFLIHSLEIGDVFSINRGKHGIKIGGHYRRPTVDLKSLLPLDTPEYYFASVLDFADDEPYQESRAVEVGTGKAAARQLLFESRELALFVQNTWQVRPNLTLNYGLRWETFFSNWLGRGRDNWQPVLTSNQISTARVPQLINQKVNRYYDTDWNNFAPRLGVAWDPTRQGKMSIRAGFGVLYDEINTLPLYATGSNPPSVAEVVAGPEFGVPIIYGLAPAGSRNFPANPNLPVPTLDQRGGIVGTRVGLGGLVQDLEVPLVWDLLGGVQYQFFTDLMVQFDYKYRRSTNDVYDVDINRFQGDLVDGRRDRLNPSFDRIDFTTNRGKRTYHGLISAFSKRFSQGWSVAGSYTYNHGKNNFARVANGDYSSNATDPFNSDLDWARDDIPHVFTAHSVWELPFLRGQSNWIAGLFGGWQFNTIWNLQSGGIFVPISGRAFGRGGDFNADGQRSDRPDRPAGKVKSTFSKKEWRTGPLKASVFPLPDPANPRPGNLPRDTFRLPGYARVDAALVKQFPVPIGRTEKGRLHIRAEFFNVFNRLNLRGVQARLDRANFGFPTSGFQNRRLQLGVKFEF